MDYIFFVNSLLLGIALSMDSFSLSLADMLSEPDMKKTKMLGIALVHAILQAFMPMAGWFCVKVAVGFLQFLDKIVPYIALIILCYIGGKMIYESFHKDANEVSGKISTKVIFFQGIAASIDALSVGFAISQYNFSKAICSALIIALVTFVVCLFALFLGKKIATKLKHAEVFGGIILILIGIEILVESFLK